MLIGKAVPGLKIVRQFFPEAKLGEEKPSRSVINALNDLADYVPEPSLACARDIVRIFDSHGVGIWGGTEIR